mmetsp:Transcript_22918/g.36903  ORF Transcript_22918/g.36903 Transcript_22918/m.36903 type:complete len:250 (+) Transcript_22918:89-838(+)
MEIINLTQSPALSTRSKRKLKKTEATLLPRDEKGNGSKRHKQKDYKTNAHSLDLLKVLGRNDFKAHNQGSEPTCTAHAVTAVHEILIGKRLHFRDIVTGREVDEDGTTVTKLSRILHTKGQREKSKSGKVLPTWHKLRFKSVDIGISTVKKALKRGLPIVAGVLNFTTNGVAVANLTLKNSKNADSGKHSIVITGYDERGNSEGGGLLKVLNSHGNSWGNDGFGTMSYGFFLANAIEIHVPAVAKKKKA